jgi:hypothetical protein
MIPVTTARSVRSRLRRTAAAAALAALTVITLPMAACAPTEFLEVTDSDIINPRDVTSPAGADAVRVGALARLNAATSGAESLFLLGGLFTDEWNNGDSFIARWEIDQRVITEANTFLTTANRVLHRARLSAEQALDLMAIYLPTAPAWQVAEMHFVQAYVVNMMAEHYCDGLVFSRVVDGREEYGTPITTAAAFERALAHATDGLALITDTTANALRVRHALQVTHGRILLNLDSVAQAATAVSGVPTTFQYNMRHSQATEQDNAFWLFNNNTRRYSVSNSEGTNGLNFATAGDPRVPVCLGGDSVCTANGIITANGLPQTKRDDLTEPLYVQLLWPTRESAVTIVNGVEARLIEAEAQLAAGDSVAALGTLNAARATVGLLPLADAGTPEARQDQLFRERAFWLFGRGHRVGDMRRLIRQYQRADNTVFPVGAWHKGGNYGPDVNMPIPFAEKNNPNLPAGPTCMNRNP